MAVTLPIEKNVILLQKYGLAVALFSTGEYLLGEMIRLIGGLNQANPELVNEIMSRKTFGSKIEMARKIGVCNELKLLIQPAVEDRNKLAHGVTVEQDAAFKLMHGKGFHDLDAAGLDDIIVRARTLSAEIIKEIQTKFKLTENPPTNAVSLTK